MAYRSRRRPALEAFAALEAADWKAPRYIAHLLTKRGHFAAFGRVWIFGQESRKSEAAKDYRRLLIGIPKTAFGVRRPVVRPREYTASALATLVLLLSAANGRSGPAANIPA
jgi:hypothetical protein